MVWWFVHAAFAGPTAVVAVGDGLVVEEAPARAVEAPVDAPAPAPDAPTVPGGWVAVLADCLEERRPNQYALLDRTAEPAIADLRRRVGEVRELAPALVIVGVGLPDDAGREGLIADLGGFVADLRADAGPEVLLVGPVAPIVDALAAEQEATDRRTRAWSDEVGKLAVGAPGVAYLDLAAAWPAAAEERAGLTLEGRRLSDQGHARVAALVCDAVLAWETAPR